MKLNPAQQRAVEHIYGPLLVLAGPGTGKTQLLSHRVAHILKHTDTSPENILCLTFTESGAANMRSRLKNLIGPAAQSVHIHTYHAFGSDLLFQYQNYSPTANRPLDSSIDEVIQFKIVKEIQENLPANDILRGDRTKNILDTITSAKSARLTAADLALIASVNLEQSAQLNSELSPILQQTVSRMPFDLALETIYQPVMEVLSKYTSDQPIAGATEREANFLLRSLHQIVTDEQAKEKPSVSPLTNWRKKHFDRTANGGYQLSNLIANKKLASVANIMHQYDEKLLEQGLFDYADMIEEAIKALSTDQGFKLTLSERFQFILLDEFQDTNPSQFELIKLLTDYEKPNVMAVGDDDQAIFEFQGANASNLLDFESHYRATTITLTENYRSTSEILQLSRHIADQITDSFAKKHQIDKSLTSVRDQNSPKKSKSQISRHEFITADAEYFWIAEQIAKLQKQGTKPSDIAVIAPKHKYIAPLLPYLKAKNIHVSYEKRDNVLDDPKIHQLIVMARFAYELAHEKPTSHRILEILSFPFWQVSQLTAVSLVNQARENKQSALDVIAKSNDPNIRFVGEFLATLALKSYDISFDFWLSYLIGTAPVAENLRSPFFDYYSQDDSYTTFELYENLRVLTSAVKRHTKAPVIKPVHFIEFLDDYEAAEAALTNTSPYQEALDAVSVLSVHKSKGEEYTHVFLISADNLSWGKAKGNNNTLTLPNNLTYIRHTGITEDEQLRLLFVAITRAKDTLTITNSKQDFSGKTPDRLIYLQEYEAEDQVISPLIPSQTVTLHYQDLADQDRQNALANIWLTHYVADSGTLRPLLHKTLERYRLSASDLTTFLDITYAGPLEFYKRKLLGAPSEPVPAGTLLGTFLHNCFEQVTNQQLSDKEALELYQKSVMDAPLPKEDIKYLLERGSLALEISLREFSDILRSKSAKAELFLSQAVFKGIPLIGIIDHLEVDEKAKTLTIYDFKTGAFSDKSWKSHSSLFKHFLQLHFYKLLLQNTPEYRNYQVNEAHILFVAPDHEQKVHDKVYVFNQADEATFHTLIQAVYHQISTLKFLDDPELLLKPDRSRNLKAIKDFIKIILAKFSHSS